MASPIGAQGVLKIAADEGGSTIDIAISEPNGLVSENLSLSTWGASFILSNRLHRWKDQYLSRRTAIAPHHNDDFQDIVLELGAGTALVGLSAGALWSAPVILTDFAAILPGIAMNVSLNQQLLKASRGAAHCASLDWSTPDAPLDIIQNGKTIESITPRQRRVTTILAADVIYDEEHPELLTATITTWLAPGPESMAILCYPLRMAYIDHIRDFWQRMEDAGLECVEEGQERGEDDWNEVPGTVYEWCVWRWSN